ncbi:MAG: protein adenylyltransferase SelO family protein, partial [Xenococcaceae cyanobacterium]
ICKLNLEMLQAPLSRIIATEDLEAGLSLFDDRYQETYRQLMLAKLGFEDLSIPEANELLETTIKLLRNSEIGYHAFFAELAAGFNYGWRENSSLILENASFSRELGDRFKELYYKCLNSLPVAKINEVGERLHDRNPKTALLRPVIESVWQPIAEEDNWQPFYNLLKAIELKN